MSNNLYNIFEGSVFGGGGEQSGVGPVELFPWLLVPGAVVAISGASILRKELLQLLRSKVSL